MWYYAKPIKVWGIQEQREISYERGPVHKPKRVFFNNQLQSTIDYEGTWILYVLYYVKMTTPAISEFFS